MKSVFIAHSDLAGGAAIAAYRIHQSVMSQGVESELWVDHKISDDWTVSSHSGGFSAKIAKFRPSLNKLPAAIVRSKISEQASFNWLPSRWPKKVNSSDHDLVHLLWFNRETLSIADVSRFKKPKIQTLQDMWAFCGYEHYSVDTRWKDGYTPESRSIDEHGVDMKRWVWNRKRKHWKDPYQLVATTEWMADMVRQSALFKDWPVEVIGNPLNVNQWTPFDKTAARELFGLPQDKKIMLFGAESGTRNLRKGFDLLELALERLSGEVADLHIVVFGQSVPRVRGKEHFATSYVGRLNDQVALRALYSAADVYANPARQEAFGQTASEAQACGLPVVVFEKTGLAEVVIHKKTGYLAKYLDVDDLAEGIAWILSRSDSERQQISCEARQWVENNFSYEVIGKQYAELYHRVCAG